MINQNISFYSKSQTLIIASIIVGMTINTSSPSQPATKQHTYTKVSVKSLVMVKFYRKLVHCSGTRIGSESNLGAKILQNQSSGAVMHALGGWCIKVSSL